MRAHEMWYLIKYWFFSCSYLRLVINKDLDLIWFVRNVITMYKSAIFRHIFMINKFNHFLSYCLQVNITDPCWWKVNTGSTKGLMLSGAMPLPEPMFTKLVPWCHIAWLSLNESNYRCFFNTLRLRQDVGHFPDIFKCIYLNENV